MFSNRKDGSIHLVSSENTAYSAIGATSNDSRYEYRVPAKVAMEGGKALAAVIARFTARNKDCSENARRRCVHGTRM